MSRPIVPSRSSTTPRPQTRTISHRRRSQIGRCGYGPRLPLLVISPWARHGYVDHTLTDQSSILRFIEDNWHLGPIPGSYAALAGSLDSMFDFDKQPREAPRTLLLDPVTGEPSSASSD